MSAGGITYGAAKPILATVVDNGLCEDDSRVRLRTNEAIKAILDEMIPVNGCATYDVQASGGPTGGYILLPKQLENAIEVEVMGGSATNPHSVNMSTDVRQGWYDIVNPFTYVDPMAQHDNPLIDMFLVPDPGGEDEDTRGDDRDPIEYTADPTTLRRKYFYPGLSPSDAVVRVTGAKRYLPITADTDYLIVQNVLAIKMMIMAIEKLERDMLDEYAKLKSACIELLTAEVKKHQLDPRNTMRRKAAYEYDLAHYNEGTMGYARARLAFELPGGHMHGKSELTRLMEMAEMRLMNKGLPVGTIEEFHAEVFAGRILAPERVKSIIVADYGGSPVDLRSIFFKYQKNGPGFTGGCANILQDEGEIFFSQAGRRRRMYRLGGHGASTPVTSDTGETATPTSSTTFTVTSALYIGTNARYIAVPGGIALEIKDGEGNWIRQWTQSEE